MYGDGYVYDGKIDLVRGTGTDADTVTILATGNCLHAAIEAADRLANGGEQDTLSVRVLNVSCIRPIDAAAVMQAALETMHLIVVEDHNTEGGLATQAADIIADFQLPCSLKRMGLTHYFPSGKAEDLLYFAGLDADSIVNAVEDEVRTEVTGGEDAFVSSLYIMLHNLQTSRFRTKAAPFVERLLNEQGYLEKLRNVWKARTVPTDKLPTNDQLRHRLGESTKESLGNILGEFDE